MIVRTNCSTTAISLSFAALITLLALPVSRPVLGQGAGQQCQSASDRDPRSASKRDPFVLPFERLALAPSELVGVAETVRARVVM